MLEISSPPRPDLPTAQRFQRELSRIRRTGQVTPGLTQAFRQAVCVSSEFRNWRRVAQVAAQYAVWARTVGDNEALLEGLQTYEGALEMGNSITLESTLAVEKEFEAQRAQRRRKKTF